GLEQGGVGRARQADGAVQAAAGPPGGVVAEGAAEDRDADAAGAVGDVAEEAAAVAEGGVLGEGVAADEQRRGAGVVDHEVDAAAAAAGAVAGQGAAEQAQVAFALDAAAEAADLAVGDGQAGEGDGGVAQGVEDAQGVVAADGDGGGARAEDRQALV